MAHILQLIGRVLVGSYFCFFFFWNYYHRTPSIQELINSNVPMPMLAFYAALATQIIAGFLVIFGFFTAYATLVLIAFTLGATFIYHRFWALVPGIERTLNTIIFIGNLSITLAALLFVLSCSL